MSAAQHLEPTAPSLEPKAQRLEPKAQRRKPKAQRLKPKAQRLKPKASHPRPTASGISPATHRRRLSAAALLLVSGCWLEPAMAAALPWDSLLSQIQESLSGTTVRAIATIIVLVTGLLVAAGETRGFSGTLLRIVFGLSIAIGAASWISFFTDSV